MSNPSKPEDAAAQPDELSRRDTVKLAAAILALGAGLGVPRRALGLAPDAARIQIKWYRGAEDGGQMVDSMDLSKGLSDFLSSPAGGRAQIKFFHVKGGELGTVRVPEQIQIKLQRLQIKLER